MRTLFQLLSATAVASSLVLATEGLARADAIAPDANSCSGKTAGAACTIDSASGTCQKAKCTKVDYKNWDRDASPAPPTIEYDCLKCIDGETPQEQEKGVTSSTDGTTPPGDGIASDQTASDPKSNGKTAESDGGGCSVAAGARTAGPWLLAFAAALLASTVRRRRAAR